MGLVSPPVPGACCSETPISAVHLTFAAGMGAQGRLDAARACAWSAADMGLVHALPGRLLPAPSALHEFFFNHALDLPNS